VNSSDPARRSTAFLLLDALVMLVLATPTAYGGGVILAARGRR